jgi:hypothetical protein
MLPYIRLHLCIEPLGPTADPAASDRPGPPDRPVGAAMLRRVLGKVLVHRLCPFGRPLCETKPPGGGPPPEPATLCAQARSCAYGVLYASSLTPRPPMALYVPPDPEGRLDLVELTLMAGAWRLYPWAVSALQQALGDGLGRRRWTFALRQVLRVRPDRRREPLGGEDLSSLAPVQGPDLLGLEPGPFEPAAEVEVRLLSPLRLLQDGRLVRADPGREPPPIPLRLLVARALDRVVGIYGDEARQAVTAELRAAVEAAAAAVPLLGQEIDWCEVPDYSARSDVEMQLGGWVGRLVYGAEAAPLLPILRAAEVLHLGKNPTSGCGRVRVLQVQGEPP